MFEPNPFPNIPAIERSPPADAKVRRIKAQLAPRMVTIGKQRKLADVMGIMSDATVALQVLTYKCDMTHGDVSLANVLYYKKDKHTTVGVLNDFDGMVFAGRHIDWGSKKEAESSKKASGDADVEMSHDDVVASLD